jgi:hypothetical protein
VRQLKGLHEVTLKPIRVSRPLRGRLTLMGFISS